METVKLSRRWLMRLIPATALAISSMGLAHADAFSPGKGAKTIYHISVASLIPHAPKDKRGVFLNLKAGERVALRQYLDLPLVLEVGPGPQDGRFVLDDQGRKITDFYTVRVLDEHGKEIREMNIGAETTALFVDQRVAVFLSEST